MHNKPHTFTSILTKLQAWTITPLLVHFVIEAVQVFGRTPMSATRICREKSGETIIRCQESKR